MIARQPVTKALGTLLETLTGKPVGYATVPIDPATGQPSPPPYTLLYSLDGDSDDGTLADTRTAGYFTYQATFVSGPTPGVADSRGTVEQAEWLADKGRGVVERPVDGTAGFRYPLTIPGATCWMRTANEAGATADPNDAIITYVTRFQLYLESV